MSEEKKATPADPYRIRPGTAADRLWQLSALLGAVGVALSAFGYMNDPHRFAFSYLTAFFVFLTIALGSIFYVFTQHLTGAAWGVTARRTAEVFGMGIPIFALLFVPIAMSFDHLYEWASHGDHGGGHGEEHGDGHGDEHSAADLLGASVAHAQDGADDHGGDDGEHGDEHGAHHTPQHALHAELLEHKHGWLNTNRVLGFAVIYFVIWTLLAFFYFRHSTLQDRSKDLKHTVWMQRAAPMAGVFFGLSLTFAGLDWVMSLEPTWYSTIYGVYLFAGSAVAGYAVIIVTTLFLRSKGLLGSAVNTEHYHDLGKMTFGFVVFWAYIGFSQMMLIWYANIPEETVYYHYRWHADGWRGVSMLLIFGHFAIPFVFLMSRKVKRRLHLLGFGCVWLLVMHVVDLYWFVMPNYERGQLVLHWMDIACLLAVGGIYLTVVFQIMRRYPLIPIGDPRLDRALGHINH
ncbi:MAG: hypothetical protein AAGF12_05165 [Myxococcota bacterium]